MSPPPQFWTSRQRYPAPERYSAPVNGKRYNRGMAVQSSGASMGGEMGRRNVPPLS